VIDHQESGAKTGYGKRDGERYGTNLGYQLVGVQKRMNTLRCEDRVKSLPKIWEKSTLNRKNFHGRKGC